MPGDEARALSPYWPSILKLEHPDDQTFVIPGEDLESGEYAPQPFANTRSMLWIPAWEPG